MAKGQESDFNKGTTRQMVSRPDEEIWESCVKGRVWVEVTDYKGAPKVISSFGVGSRLRITTMDRVRNQEAIRNPQDDPFINGMLRRTDSEETDEYTASSQTHSDDDLKSVFELSQDAFEEYVKELNEVNVRRMKEMAVVHASVLQDQFLTEQLQTRWPIGGDTPTYREMTGTPQ